MSGEHSYHLMMAVLLSQQFHQRWAHIDLWAQCFGLLVRSNTVEFASQPLDGKRRVAQNIAQVQHFRHHLRQRYERCERGLYINGIMTSLIFCNCLRYLNMWICLHGIVVSKRVNTCCTHNCLDVTTMLQNALDACNNWHGSHAYIYDKHLFCNDMSIWVS